MAAVTLFGQPFLEARSPEGPVYVGAKFYFYLTGTSTPQPVYTDSGLSVAWTQPITTNADGQSTGPVYVTPTPSLKIVAVDAADVPLPGYPVDPWTPPAVAT